MKCPSVVLNTACYRGYIGTWQFRNDLLHLETLCLLSTKELGLSMNLDGERHLMPNERRYFLSLVPAADFPVPATWFNGQLRVMLGRRLIYAHMGYQSWFEKVRVITCKSGRIIRDRIVDTKAILEWHFNRHPEHADWIRADDAERGQPGPLVWFDNSEDDDSDWWPPDVVCTPDQCPNWWPKSYPKPRVPERVNLGRLQMALIAAGMFDGVNASIDGSSLNPRIKSEWQAGRTKNDRPIRQSDRIVRHMVYRGLLSWEQLDALFIAAA